MEIREILFVISLSISLPVISCLIIYKRIDRNRFPLFPIFICTTLGLLAEVGSFVVGENNIFTIYFNFYTLIEFILLQLQLYLWSKFLNISFPLKLVVFVVIIWFITVFMIGDPEKKNIPFIIIYSFAMIMTCIKIMNNLIFSTKSLAKNFLLLVCISFIAIYTFAIIVEFFCMFNKLFSSTFIVNIFYIKSILNGLSNITLAIALLCIPKKQQYSLSF